MVGTGGACCAILGPRSTRRQANTDSTFFMSVSFKCHVAKRSVSAKEIASYTTRRKYDKMKVKEVKLVKPLNKTFEREKEKPIRWYHSPSKFVALGSKNFVYKKDNPIFQKTTYTPCYTKLRRGTNLEERVAAGAFEGITEYPNEYQYDNKAREILKTLTNSEAKSEKRSGRLKLLWLQDSNMIYCNA